MTLTDMGHDEDINDDDNVALLDGIFIVGLLLSGVVGGNVLDTTLS